LIVDEEKMEGAVIEQEEKRENRLHNNQDIII